MRVFVALGLPLEIRKEIERIQELIKKRNFFVGKFTEFENLHLTLKFLGEIEEEKVEEVRKRLLEIKFKEFFAELGEVGVFSEDFVRIVWVRLEGDGVFGLQREIDAKLFGLFEKEPRFMSHITIARVKKLNNKKGLMDFLKKIVVEKKRFKIDEFILESSELTREKAVYREVGRVRLLG